MLKEKGIGKQKMITGISGFGFIGPRMAVSWHTPVFQKMLCWNPSFYSVFWVCAFWAKLSTTGNFGHPPKKKKLTDNWFLCFFVFWGFKGQVRWPEGPPRLALNPPYFSWFFLFFVCFVFLCFFSFLCFSLKKPVLPPKKEFFVYLWVSPFVSPEPFLGLPVVQFLSFSLSLSLLLFCFFPSCLFFSLVPYFCLFLCYSVFFVFV